MSARRIDRHRLLKIAAYLVPIAVVLFGCRLATEPPVEARDGVIDLRQHDFNHPVALEGEWLALRGTENGLAESLEKEADSWKPVDLPGYFEDHGFPHEGVIWYRLQVLLPRSGLRLKGYVQHADNAHAVYVTRDGGAPHLAALVGNPTSSPATTVHSRTPALFSLPGDQSFVIYWKIASHDYLRGGPFSPMVIGSTGAVHQMVLWKIAAVFTMFGIYILVALSFLLYWTMHRRDMQSLFVGLVSIVMAVRTAVMAGALEYLLPALVDFEVRVILEAVTFLLMPGLVLLLLGAFFPHDVLPIRIGRFTFSPSFGTAFEEIFLAREQHPPPERKKRLLNTVVVFGTVLISVVTTAAALIGSAETASHVMAVARYLFLFSAAGSLFILFQVIQRRRPMAAGVAVGLLILVVSGVHDILLAAGILRHGHYLASYGFLGFILAQSYTVARRDVHYAEVAHRSSDALREDVAERTKELRAATIAAHAANIAKSQFISAVSHELRSPLTSILGYAKILQEELRDRAEPQHIEFFESIRQSGDRLIVLINDILDIAKIEAGKLDLQLASVNLQEVCEEVVDQLYPLARDKSVGLRTEFADQSHAVRADPLRLRQVILNLASNAVKFTLDGEVIFRTSMAELDGNPAVALHVCDTGLGISPEFMPHLFDRFTQEKRLYDETQRGTGLGLSISHELATRMHGRIEVESTPEVGSTFTLLIPTAESPERWASEHPHSPGVTGRRLETAM